LYAEGVVFTSGQIISATSGGLPKRILDNIGVRIGVITLFLTGECEDILGTTVGLGIFTSDCSGLAAGASMEYRYIDDGVGVCIGTECVPVG
jgi:hypothetical protein